MELNSFLQKREMKKRSHSSQIQGYRFMMLKKKSEYSF